MKQIIKNVRDCYNHIPYTWKHWIAFMKTEKKLLGYHSHWFHDWDKLILFIFFPFLGERIINQFHQRINKHHPTYPQYKEFVEPILKELDL